VRRIRNAHRAKRGQQPANLAAICDARSQADPPEQNACNAPATALRGLGQTHTRQVSAIGQEQRQQAAAGATAPFLHLLEDVGQRVTTRGLFGGAGREIGHLKPGLAALREQQKRAIFAWVCLIPLSLMWSSAMDHPTWPHLLRSPPGPPKKCPPYSPTGNIPPVQRRAEKNVATSSAIGSNCRGQLFSRFERIPAELDQEATTAFSPDNLAESKIGVPATAAVL